MTSPISRLRPARSAGFISAGAVLLSVALGNVVNLLLTNPNPLLTRARLPLQSHTPNWIFPTLWVSNANDQNDGTTTQALAPEAIRQIFHGQLPLWNHFQGLGMPLLAEMQSGALFPFTLLQALPSGYLLEHMVLEAVAGIGALLLLRVLGLSYPVATAGAVVAALSGTFEMQAHAPALTATFAPWLVLGVELAWRSERRLGGWWVLSLALGLSILAGFPETLYLNGLFVALWALVRLVHAPRKLRYLCTLAVGAGGGAALAAPALVTFLGYLPIASVGEHVGDTANQYHITYSGLVDLLFPYAQATVFHIVDPTRVWANNLSFDGGYLTMGIALLSVIGLFYRKAGWLPPLAAGLWIVLSVSRIYGVPVLGAVLFHLPGMGQVAAYRYMQPSMLMAAVILGSFGLQSLIDGTVRLGWRLAAGILSLLAVVGLAVYARYYIVTYAHPTLVTGRNALLLWLAIGVGPGLLAAAVVLAAVFGWRWCARFAVPVVVAAEAIALFLVPQFGQPARPATVDTAAVTFLQNNLGDSRFYTLGAIQPNYGSYFGVAQLNINTFPSPNLWVHTVRQLDGTGASRFVLTGTRTTAPSSLSAFTKNLALFEQVGVKYLVASAGTNLNELKQDDGLKTAWSDANTVILELPDASAYATADGCTVQTASYELFTVHCAQPSHLVRRELALPGWHATVDGSAAAITPVRAGGLSADALQSVPVPAGDSTVRFDYWPRGVTASLAAVAAAILAMLACGIVGAVRLRRR